MGKDGPVVCEEFQVGGTCVRVLVDGAASHFSGGAMQCLVVNFWMSMGLAWLWEGYMLMCSVALLFL